jgi:hypothetical protein
MQIILSILLAPVFMILMAPTIGSLWLLKSIAWATKNYKKPKKPDSEKSGPITNLGFQWLWWVLNLGFWKIVSSKWFRLFEPRKSDFSKNTPEWVMNFINKENHGLMEKILTMILFTILGFIWGFLSGFGVSLQFSSTILGDVGSSEEDVHTTQDQLFMKTGRFSN